MKFGKLDSLQSSSITPYEKQDIYYAANDSQVTAFGIYTKDNRGQECDNCNLSCASTLLVYTRPGFRRQGIFTQLFEYVKQTSEYTKIYVTRNTPPEGALIARRYSIPIPKQYNYNYGKYSANNDFADSIMDKIQLAVFGNG